MSKQKQYLTSADFDIHQFEVGPMQNLIYFVGDRRSHRAAVVDPAWDSTQLIKYARSRDFIITDVLLSHSHHDHVNGLPEILAQCDPVIHLTREEMDFWKDPPRGRMVVHRDGDKISLGGTTIEVVHTPGHTPGSACFYLQGYLLTGGTLLVFGCGRCDLPGGDATQTYYSLSRLKRRFPGSTVILPGHHYAAHSASTMAEQLWGNPFLHIDDLDAFIEFRRHHNEYRHPPYAPVPS